MSTDAAATTKQQVCCCPLTSDLSVLTSDLSVSGFRPFDIRSVSGCGPQGLGHGGSKQFRSARERGPEAHASTADHQVVDVSAALGAKPMKPNRPVREFYAWPGKRNLAEGMW